MDVNTNYHQVIDELKNPDTVTVTTTQPPSGVCPHCGHCPHCGSPQHPQYPQPWPNWPQPYIGDSPGWYGGTSGQPIVS